MRKPIRIFKTSFAIFPFILNETLYYQEHLPTQTAKKSRLVHKYLPADTLSEGDRRQNRLKVICFTRTREENFGNLIKMLPFDVPVEISYNIWYSSTKYFIWFIDIIYFLYYFNGILSSDEYFVDLRGNVSIVEFENFFKRVIWNSICKTIMF